MLPVFVKTIGNQNPSNRFSTAFVSHANNVGVSEKSLRTSGKDPNAVADRVVRGMFTQGEKLHQVELAKLKFECSDA